MLEIKNINKEFNKGTVNAKQIFSDFSLKIKNDDFITIIGSNGAGKSTLLNIIAGSINVDSGEIILDNKNITFTKEYKRSKKICRVFQNPELGTAGSMSILENISMVLNKNKRFILRKGVNSKNINYIKEILSELSLGLENKLNTSVSLLSGGQKQALAVIMAILNTPSLLLLDEHTAALDPNTASKVLNITNKLIKEYNIPTLMVTHNMNDAIKYGNRLIMLNEGKIILDVKAEEKTKLNQNDLINYFKKLQTDRMLLI